MIMKRILLLQLTLLVSLLAQAWPYPKDGTLLDGLRYEITGSVENPEGVTAKVITYKSSANDVKYSGIIHIPPFIKVKDTVNGKEVEADVPVTEINGEAFSGCTELTEIHIPASVTKIWKGAFSGCTGLTEIHIPASVTKIWKNAFAGCTGLKKVHMESIAQACTTEYEQADANPLSAGKHLYIGGSEVTELAIPDEVTSIGQYAFVNCEGITSVTIPSTVTSIGMYAFVNCEGITEVHIPNSVKTIYNDAFAGCTGLERAFFTDIKQLCSIDFYNNDANPLAFAKHLYFEGSEEEVTELNIPEGVTSIENYAFVNCESITKVTIPETIDYIGADAFSGFNTNATAIFASERSLCSIHYANAESNPIYITHTINIGERRNVTNIEIPAECLSVYSKELGRYILAGATSLVNVKMPAGVRYIGYDAFLNCENLENVDFQSPEDLIKISYENDAANPMKYAKTLTIKGSTTTTITLNEGPVSANQFINCKWLKEVVLGENVTAIGDNAFNGCTALEHINLPETLESIGNYAFRSCTALKDLTFKSSLRSIGVEAFRDCKALTTVIIPGSCELDFGAFRYCSNLSKVVLPSTLTTVPESAFEYCSNLTTVEMPAVTKIQPRAFYGCALEEMPVCNNLLSIGEYAFSNNTKLTALNLSGSSQLTNIYKGAFQGCSGISALTLPVNVSKIYEDAFSGCTALTQVFCEALKAPETKTNAFGGRESKMTLFVKEKAAGFDDSPWNGFIPGGSIKETTMTFYVNDEFVASFKQQSGTAVSSDKVPTVQLKENETFMGWSSEIPKIMPNENMIFYGYKSINANDIGGYSYTLYPAEEKNDKKLKCRATLVKIVKELNENEGNVTLKDSVAYGDIKYPVTYIAPHAFEGNTMIKFLTLPSKLDSIGAYAFKGCSKLQTVSKYPDVTKVTDGQFENCSSLTAIFVGNTGNGYQLSDAVTKIGKTAFKGCGSLQINKLPVSLTDIGTQAFYASGFKELVIPASVKNLGVEVFRECGNLEKVEFAEGSAISTLPERTFWNCRKLSEVSFVGTMEMLDKSAFEGCVSLKNIFLPEGVSKISQQAFKGCSALSNVVLPSTISYIGTKVFEASDNIKQVTVLKAEAPFAVNDAFDDVVYEKALLYVPVVAKYAEADMWKSFKNKVARTECKLTYKVDGATHKETSVMAGSPVEALDEPQKEGHEFSGWEGVPDVMPAKDVKVTGRFQYFIKYYDGSTKDDDHRLLKDEKFAFFYGDDITIPLEGLKKKDHKFQLTGLLDNNEVVEEDNVAELQMTMPARDIDVIVNYQHSEQELTAEGITYKVFIMDNYAEVLKGDATKETVDIPDTVTYNNKNYPVKVIGANAFKDFKKLKRVTLPDNLTTIGDYAFCNTPLTSVTLPAKLESIGTKAFDHCQQLTAITIPASVKRMGNEMFVWCTRLTDVTINAAISTLPGRTFQNCKNLADIEIPSQIETIGEKAFEGCDQLSAVTLSEGLKHIGDGAFNGCSKIRSLEIPTSVETIGDNAFYNVFGKGTNEDGEEVSDVIILKGQTLPEAQHTTFDEGAYEKAVLQTNISVEGVAPWDGFPVKPISEETPTGTTPCETPVITYEGGKITVTCATPDAKIYCKVTVADNQNQTSEGKAEIALTKTYVVTAYAKKEGMSKSQTATHTLTLDQGDVNGDGDVDTRDAIAILKKVVE